MNSAPMNGMRSSEAPNRSSETASVTTRWRRHTCRPRPYASRTRSYRGTSGSLTTLRRKYAHSTGSSVSVHSSDPTSANDIVSAMGRNNRPDGPVST